ncbi:hypothetical protein [Desmospora profundinema]|uniref:Uncharacterized protein n=1 Tax=Desmospora profundinema TaxID=1571184 RepID=A0ABU1IRE7_9BACL|nr:hypothetical protein [Desmospora profundinema]MDR6227372.1 hypothetical protein [Desmospora profundinema]
MAVGVAAVQVNKCWRIPLEGEIYRIQVEERLGFRMLRINDRLQRLYPPGFSSGGDTQNRFHWIPFLLQGHQCHLYLLWREHSFSLTSKPLLLHCDLVLDGRSVETGKSVSEDTLGLTPNWMQTNQADPGSLS